MIKHLYISLFLLGTILVVGQPNPQSKKITNDFFPDPVIIIHEIESLLIEEDKTSSISFMI